MSIRFSSVKLSLAILALAALGAGQPSTAPTVTAGRPASAILADLSAITDPTVDQAKVAADPAARAAYLKARAEVAAKRAPLTLELYKTSPDAPELQKLLPARWMYLSQDGRSQIAIAEITEFLCAHPDSPIHASAANQRVLYEIDAAKDAAGRQAALAEYEKSSPNNPRLPAMIRRAHTKATDAGEQKIYADRLVKEFPDNQATKMTTGATHAADLVGKPFPLSFTDAITGKPVTMADYKGKVVVIDFWATWCGPCKAELPKLSAFYHKYHDRGVEVVSISLDRPDSLKVLQDFVASHDMPWAHYYQGNYWDSEFSAGLGVSAIPAMFVVDADGKLANIEARAKLEPIVNDLLAQRDKTAAAQ